MCGGADVCAVPPLLTNGDLDMLFCKSRNINIGVPRVKVEVANEIEKRLIADGIHYDNSGSSSQIKNINAGFDDVEESEWFEEWLRTLNVFFTTETFYH